MKSQRTEGVMLVQVPPELNATNAATFREGIRAALTPTTNTVDFDLSKTRFVDSSGLGALIAIHKTMLNRSGQVRVINPGPSVLQILEVTRLNRLFEVVHS